MEGQITPQGIHDLRRKILEKEPYTKEELKQAVKALVGDRVAASQAEASKPTRRKAKKTVSLDSFLPS